jgi:hypothetical protein
MKMGKTRVMDTHTEGRYQQVAEAWRYAKCRQLKCAASAAKNEGTEWYWDCWNISCAPNLSLSKDLNPERERGV